ncbi:MAG: methyltransferase domain-containing protein [Nitrospirae bacterium]|nr:methyltransferase domain-containing protein [Nitrospirota bacterium]
MPELIITVLGGILVVVIGLAAERLYREVFFFEGIRLGGRLHRWLYDRWALTYDRDKKKVQNYDDRNLAGPLIERLTSNSATGPDILVLDVGTGTGRFPAVLLGNPLFTGRIIGLDISPNMLKQASIKLAKYGSRAVSLNQPALALPFPEGTFDVVSCLETIELLPDRHAHLSEFYRVMKPGGILMISRNTGEWGIQGSECRPEIFSEQLLAVGFEKVEITPWWKWFDLVWARKPDGI